MEISAGVRVLRDPDILQALRCALAKDVRITAELVNESEGFGIAGRLSRRSVSCRLVSEVHFEFDSETHATVPGFK